MILIDSEKKPKKHFEIEIFFSTMNDAVGCLLAWASLLSVALGNLMSSRFVVVDDFKLDDKPLMDISENKWSAIRCSLLCQNVENCESLSVKKDGTRCKLFNVSVFGIGSTPVKDNQWQTLGKPGEI